MPVVIIAGKGKALKTEHEAQIDGPLGMRVEFRVGIRFDIKVAVKATRYTIVSRSIYN